MQTPLTDPADRNDNEPATFDAAGVVITGSEAIGMCQGFIALDAGADEDRNLVRDAFHWDMLSAAQMEASAAAGELPNPRTYGKTFGGLNGTQRTNVRALFTRMIIARGVGPLTLQNDGIDTEATIPLMAKLALPTSRSMCPTGKVGWLTAVLE